MKPRRASGADLCALVMPACEPDKSNHSKRVMAGGIGELMATLGHAGQRRICLQESIRVAVAGIAQAMMTQKTPTAYDVARDWPSEIGYINGYVTRRASAY